jgi:serine/threonine protein kinase/CheY-like chemotaxis protein
MKGRILVIDDEESIRSLLQDILEANGFEVLTAEEGVAGVKKTFSMAPDAVLTDVMMPGMNGLSFMKRVRSQISADRLPIIVVSALGMESQVVEAFNAGATDYLVKPFKPGELIARIQVALQRRVDPEYVVYKEPTGPADLRSPIRSGSFLDMGKYRILSEIGSGGMGNVYRARHRGYGIEVALKVLKPELVDDQKNILRFLREVRIATQMNHPNIVQVFDVGTSNGCYYYAMEALPCRSLLDRVRESGALPEPEVLLLGERLSSALDFMHSQGFMHRDVKPDNILFTNEGGVKLIDFGLACAHDDARLTQEGTFIGTPGYVAPENVSEYRALRPNADIYSLGATLFFAATGRSAFPEGNGATAKLTAQVNGDAAPLREANPRISEALAGVITKMLERDPEDRYAFIKQVYEAFMEMKVPSPS